ncbi:hypothetical protein CDD83_6563 [Cordyceps sp. RAO-2017]|nr:hypothetical protein CDD83_6563 [Cordyceps sp. RAO-2017]
MMAETQTTTMTETQTTMTETRTMEASPAAWETPRAPAAGGDDGRWTAEDEERALVLNRGLAADRYRRGACLGQGGSARVYKLLRLADGRLLAGKVSGAVAELRREAEVLRALRHDKIVKFVDWHEEAGKPEATTLVTELCAHGTLRSRIKDASPCLARGELLLVLRQMGLALDFLHRQGLWHADLKPGNILIRGLEPIDVVLGDSRRRPRPLPLPP